MAHRDRSADEHGGRSPAPILADVADVLVERAPFGLVLFDGAGRPLRSNSAALTLLGLTSAELLASRNRDLLDLAPVLAAVDRSTSWREQCHRELWRKDGSRVWLRVVLVPADDPRFGDASVLGFLSDVTAEYRLERELRTASAGLDELVRSAPRAMAAVDMAGDVQLWNPAAEQLLDRPFELAAGNPLVAALGAASGPVEAMLEQALAGETVQDTHLVGHRRDGVPVQLEVVLAPFRADGSVNGAIVLFADVTEARAEDRVRRSHENQLRTILANINDTITLIDDRGNAQAGTGQIGERILGFTNSFWTGANIIDLIHPADSERAIASFAELLAEPGRRMTEEFRVKDADGEWQTVEGVAVNLIDDPDVGAVLLTTRNITDRKRTEELLEAQARILALVAGGAQLAETLGAITDLVARQTPRGRCGIAVSSQGSTPALLVGSLREELAGRVIQALGHRARPPSPDGGGRPRPTLIDDLAGHPDLVSLSAELVDAGWASAWLMPIRSTETSSDHGVMLCVFDARRELATHELEVALLAADLAAIAVDRDRVERRLAHLAMHDELTGLANRHLLFNRLEQACSRAGRHGHRLAIMFVDLDRFKMINDTLGHEAGDVVLREFSDRLRNLVRPEDTVARVGGDEFVILIEPVHADRDVAAVAERVDQILEQPFEVAGTEIFVTASVGLHVGMGDKLDPNELVRNADTAMYRAKRHGRNQLEVYNETLRDQLGDRLRMESELRLALQRGELSVRYRPMVEIATGRIAAAALVPHWVHPRLGPIDPAAYLALADETGLSPAVGDLLLGRGLSAISDAIRRRGVGEACDLILPVTARLAADDGLVERVVAALGAASWPTGRLVALVPEQAISIDGEPTMQCLGALHALGVRLAASGFGGGGAPLARFDQLPFSSVHLSSALLNGVAAPAAVKRETGATGLLAGVIALTHALGMTAVVDQVGAAVTLFDLAALGVDMAADGAPDELLDADELAEALALSAQRREPYQQGV